MVGLCRLCASLRKINALITIKDDCNAICQKLRKCCQLNIQMQDALPKSVCQECVEILNISYKFYMKVQDAQETLQTLFPSTNTTGDISENEACAALAHTLTGLNGHKRKLSFDNNQVLLSNTDDELTYKEYIESKKKMSPNHKKDNTTTNIKTETIHVMKTSDPKKKKASTNTEEISIKNIKTKTIQSQKTNDCLEENLDISVNNDNKSESLESEENDKYLHEVYNMLGMTKDGAVENSNELLEAREETEQEEVTYVNNLEKECLLGEHHILQETVNEEVVMESSDNEFAVEEDIEVVVVSEDDNEIDLEMQYLEVDNEEEDEKNQSEIEVKRIENDKLPEKPISTFPSELQINSWKSYTYLCTDCEYKAATLLDLRAHAESKHGLKCIDKLQYKCYDCQKIISRYNFFLNHIRSKHHCALKLQCDACDLNCQNYEQLSFHRSDCSEATNFADLIPCTQCFKSFHSTFGLQNHLKLQHTLAKNKLKYKCSQCGKEFSQKSCLKAHELTHTDIKKYSCRICDSTFAIKQGLDLHLYSHIEEKSFKCNICGKSFKTFLTLDQHQVIHSDLKPFKCHYCDKEFRKKIEKITHERIHTGEMPFQCQHCEKRFRFLSALVAHTRTHNGIKPFACKYCDQTFADSSNCNKHVKRKHPNGENT